MKVDELMIGNFLRYKQDFPDTHLRGKIVKVCGIRGRVDVRTVDDGEYHESVHPNWLEPIPLTPEILEKNGFKSYGESWYLPDDDVNVMVGFYMHKTTINVKIGDNIFQKEVNCSYRACAENRDVHVHTLQNAIRLCGTEKEITI